ncbi:MAG TPA: RHS repeat-associated core domain-containing protein [Pyrinomonadaceae bacterium]|nr:RHS repeat-associated core domain-containing protein [Pyrinomonadaceae bacterium]
MRTGLLEFKQRDLTDTSGTVVSTIELDPWGGDTSRSSNQAFQPKRFTSYDRDVNGSDEAMFRRYNRWHGRFDQPDPYDGSYNLADPQGFNRYAYVQNDPVNFTDPTGLDRFDDKLGPPPPPPTLVPPSGPLPRVIIYTDDRAIRIGTTDWGGFLQLPVVSNPRGDVGGGVLPQNTAPQNPYPGCITAEWFVNTPEAKKFFNDLWQRSEASGKENGGWAFYEPKTNRLIGKWASEGERFSMPNELLEFEAQMAQFRQNGQSVIFMFDIHTHPGGTRNYSAGDLGNLNAPAKRRASVGVPGGHFPVGIIVYGPGQIHVYSNGGPVNMNGCL